MKYSIHKLGCGVNVVAAPLKERRSVAIGIWVGVGGRDEEPRLSGVSHFLEHIVFKGTSTRSASKIKEGVEGVGGSLNAFTSEEYTCFLSKCASRYFVEVFDVLADMVMNASLKTADIEKERTVIMEEIKMTQDHPSQLADELLAGIVWPHHALGRPLAGTLSSVGALSRRDISDYMKKYYKPPYITIVAAGAIDEKTLIKTVENKFRGIAAADERKRDFFREAQSGPLVSALGKKTEQTHLAFALRTFPKDHPDEHALDILSVILGGNMSSRLFNEVREERGLAYEIGSSTRKYHETGAFGVEAGVDNNKAFEAARVILSELKKVTRELVSPGELRRAKEFYLGQTDMALESSMSTMLWVGEGAVCLGRCRTYEEVVRFVEKIRRDDLRRVAKNIFKTQALNLAIVGPKAEELKKQFSKALTF